MRDALALIRLMLALFVMVAVAGCGGSKHVVKAKTKTIADYYVGIWPPPATHTRTDPTTVTGTVAVNTITGKSPSVSVTGRGQPTHHPRPPAPRSYTMYDTLYPSVLPHSTQIIASYVGDGRTGFVTAQQLFPTAAVVSINESPGDPVAADFWGDEQDVTAAGWPQLGFSGGGGWSADEVAAAIAHGLAKGGYGTPGPGFGLAKIQSLLTHVYHIPRSHYLLWSDGLVGHHRIKTIPPGADANQGAIDLGNGNYDEDEVTATFLTRLGLPLPSTR